MCFSMLPAGAACSPARSFQQVLFPDGHGRHRLPALSHSGLGRAGWRIPHVRPFPFQHQRSLVGRLRIGRHSCRCRHKTRQRYDMLSKMRERKRKKERGRKERQRGRQRQRRLFSLRDRESEGTDREGEAKGQQQRAVRMLSEHLMSVPSSCVPLPPSQVAPAVTASAAWPDSRRALSSLCVPSWPPASA